MNNRIDLSCWQIHQQPFCVQRQKSGWSRHGFFPSSVTCSANTILDPAAPFPFAAASGGPRECTHAGISRKFPTLGWPAEGCRVVSQGPWRSQELSCSLQQHFAKLNYCHQACLAPTAPPKPTRGLSAWCHHHLWWLFCESSVSIPSCRGYATCLAIFICQHFAQGRTVNFCHVVLQITYV